ncbi:MAG: DNA repair protein RecN [Defluviitaleaceae bacterium]|nr:DNA repair protein RecN [Defluviitaleaceae bacterium]
MRVSIKKVIAMIENLQIKNVALIEKIDVDFTAGLNILSGETGAGKSILIDSINFLMGNRIGKDFIRTGEYEAEVSGVFFLSENADKIKELGVEVDDDSLILINRKINTAGKGSIRINGRTTTLSVLKEISQYLIDFHGQHEHQSLLKASKHIELLDRFCGTEFEEIKVNLKDNLKEHKEISEKIAKLSGGDMDKNSKIDFLKFQIDEIEDANLKENEEDELLADRKLLSNMENVIQQASKVLGLLYSGDNDDSAIDKLHMASELILEIGESDADAENFSETIQEITAELEGFIRQVRKYHSNLEDDPERLQEVNERLELISKLKRKYGKDIMEILTFYKKATEEYEFLINSAELLLEYEEKQIKILEKIKESCVKLNKIRLKNAKIIEEQIENHLKDLGMKNAEFKINIETLEEFNQNGNNRVEFLITPNAGEPLKQLAKIASGGEMSRIMLSLKTVLASVDSIGTFIFDEIDAGVSGRTAQMVAEKLAVLASFKQILCITHLPQIAAMSDSHYLIEKSTVNNNTKTSISKLEENGVITEVARLIGGATITENTLNAAKELRVMAKR